MEYIDEELLRKEVEKHIKEVKDAAGRFTPNMGFFDAKLSGIYDVINIIDSLQQEQPELPNIAEYYYHKGVYEGLSQGRADALKILEESMKRKADPVIVIKQQEQQEVELEKFTEKMDVWKARYNNYPDNIIVKGTMAFTARMFYMYPKVAREWYDSLPKVTLD